LINFADANSYRMAGFRLVKLPNP